MNSLTYNPLPHRVPINAGVYGISPAQSAMDSIVSSIPSYTPEKGKGYYKVKPLPSPYPSKSASKVDGGYFVKPMKPQPNPAHGYRQPPKEKSKFYPAVMVPDGKGGLVDYGSKFK